MKKFNKVIFLFHRSLRLNDNIGLIHALNESKHVIPIFIFTPEQITEKNKYRSLNGIKFMIDALIDLNNQLNNFSSKLYLFYGKQDDILEKIMNNNDIDAIYFNKDYTPYAIKRENALLKKNFNCQIYEDYLLHNINSITNKKGDFYSVFSAFYNEALNHDVNKPKKILSNNFINKKTVLKKIQEIDFDQINEIYNKKSIEIDLYDFIATRDYALKKLNQIKNHKKYAETRDLLSLETTKLSPYLKFGLVSIREVFHKIVNSFGIKHELIRQLFWRDYYYNISFNRPDILLDSKTFKTQNYDNIVWKNDKTLFDKWKNGNTGYPLVDASMRELNTTGYMHNRGRMIVADFLVKHLNIDWRIGERYFASKLLDYDPSINNGNWQFISANPAQSTRVMNPWRQSIKYDKNCGYIKSWIPELKNIPNDEIHNWYLFYKNYNVYTKPCIKYDFEKLKKGLKKIYKY